MDPKIVDRYIKVMALADRGVSGERKSARERLSAMETKHPGLRAAAKAEVQRRQAAQNQGQPAPGVWQKGDNSVPFNPFTNWQDVLGMAQEVYTNVYQFVETAAESQRGRDVAGKAKASMTVTRAGNVIIGLKMTVANYHEAVKLNALQRQSFRERMHELLDGQLDKLLGEEDD